MLDMEKWTGKIERPLRVWTNPRITDDIYLHFSEILKKIKNYSHLIKGKVLDVGAGKSPYKLFFNNATEYITLDAADYPGIDIKADITKKIPCKNNSFDSVVCFQVLEHVKSPEKAVNEIYRVLKPGGFCLLTTHMAAPLHGEPYDYYRFTEYALRELFKKFKKVEIKENGGAALSIFQLMAWGVADRIPKPFSIPLVVMLNLFGKLAEKLFHSRIFTLNYSVLAEK